VSTASGWMIQGWADVPNNSAVRGEPQKQGTINHFCNNAGAAAMQTSNGWPRVSAVADASAGEADLRTLAGHFAH